MLYKAMITQALELAPIVMVLVAILKGAIGLRGKALTISSLVVGMVLGGASQYALQPPQDFSGWFVLVVYGLVVGAMASGAYKLADRWTGKQSPA